MTQWLGALDPGLMIVGIALAGVFLSVPFFVASLRRLRRLKLVRGTLYLLFGGVVVLVGVAAGLVATNLVTYARLTHEQEAARVTTRAARRAPVCRQRARRPAGRRSTSRCAATSGRSMRGS